MQQRATTSTALDCNHSATNSSAQEATPSRVSGVDWSISMNTDRDRDRTFSRHISLHSFIRHVIRLLIILYVAAFPQSLFAGLITQDFYCGSIECGTLTVTHDDAVSAFSSPFQVVTGDNTSYSILAGMNITATATPKTGGSAKWAWMQALITDISPEIVRDKNNTILDDPYPDTPPGGYIIDPFGPYPGSTQVFDDKPWYGNYNIGNLTLVDVPKSFSNTDLDFESWLVCVLIDSFNPSAYDVIPLIGFTWGFDVTKGPDGADVGNVAGDSISEYTGNTFRGGLIQGGQPSTDFKNGYAKYFSIDYLANNDQNCIAFNCISEPSTFALFAFGLIGLIATRRKCLVH